jgi:putative ABC transport system permease protein
MKFLPLIWSGIWRKPGRTILIILQVAIAFALFGVLQGMKTGVEVAITRTRADLLFVQPDVIGEPPLPLAYRDKIQALPDISLVTFADGILGTYQKPDQPVYVLCIEPREFWLTLVPEILKVAPRDLEALRKHPTGVLISADMAKKYNWRVGDRIPLTSPVLQKNGSGNWVFEVVGFFTAHEISAGSYIVGNYSYLDEARVANKGTVRNFYVITSDPRRAGTVADAIDRMFANAPSETSTATLRENAQQGLKALGDLNFVIRSIVSAVFAALLFSTATMLMQSIRERTPELAMLKTIGFTGRTMFLLIVTEAASMCVVGALLGLALAWFAFPFTAKWIPGLTMPLLVIETGVIAACLVALISAALPARQAARLRVVDALAGR